MVCCFCLIVTPLKKGIFFLYLTRLIFTIPLCCTDTKASFHTLCLAHIETLMLHWSMRRLKQFKGSFVWSALESPWSSKLLDWQGVPRLLGKTALWTPVSWSKNVPGRHGLFFFVIGCYIPHKTPQVLCYSLWEMGVGGGDVGGGVTHAAPPFHLDIWHTDIEDLSWNKHGVLCHSCNVCASEPRAYRAENR